MIAVLKDYLCFEQKIYTMKKIYLLMVGMGLFFQSCVTTEEVNVKSSGEVTYNLGFNFSEMLKAVPDKSAMMKGKEGLLELVNGKEFTTEELMDVIAANDVNAAKKKDSILAANPNYFKDTENLRVKMLLKDSIGQLDLKVLAKNVTELNTSIKKLKEISESAKDDAKKGKANRTEIPSFIENSKYEYNKNVFARTVNIPATENKKESESMGGMGQMFSYEIKATFDKPIASVSLQGAKVSADGKSFTKRFTLIDVIQNPKIIEYKVELRK